MASNYLAQNIYYLLQLSFNDLIKRWIKTRSTAVELHFINSYKLVQIFSKEKTLYFFRISISVFIFGIYIDSLTYVIDLIKFYNGYKSLIKIIE